MFLTLVMCFKSKSLFLKLIDVTRQITSEMINESLRPPCILPLLIHTSPEAAQVYFDLAIGSTLFICILFLPCLLFLVVI